MRGCVAEPSPQAAMFFFHRFYMSWQTENKMLILINPIFSAFDFFPPAWEFYSPNQIPSSVESSFFFIVGWCSPIFFFIDFSVGAQTRTDLNHNMGGGDELFTGFKGGFFFFSLASGNSVLVSIFCFCSVKFTLSFSSFLFKHVGEEVKVSGVGFLQKFNNDFPLISTAVSLKYAAWQPEKK